MFRCIICERQYVSCGVAVACCKDRKEKRRRTPNPSNEPQTPTEGDDPAEVAGPQSILYPDSGKAE